MNRPNSSKINFPYSENFINVEIQPMPIASSDIRKKIQENQPIVNDVPDVIREDILQLYKNHQRSICSVNYEK